MNDHSTYSSRSLTLGESVLSFLLRAIPIKHGKHRLLDRIAPRVWEKSEQPVSLKYYGKDILIDPNDLVGWHFLIIRSFDPEVVDVLLSATDSEEEDILWDIGANKGACSYSVASEHPLIKIVAVEPQSILSKNNNHNLETLCPGRYEYVQAGLSDKESELTLVIPKNNKGRASFHIDSKEEGTSQEVVKIKTAEQVQKESKFGWPTLIKIDVEGHEPNVFKAIEPCLKNRKCKVIVFENHASERNAFEIAKSMSENNGYDIFAIKKTLWATKLEKVKNQLEGVTDYVIMRRDLTSNARVAKLIR